MRTHPGASFLAVATNISLQCTPYSYSCFFLIARENCAFSKAAPPPAPLPSVTLSAFTFILIVFLRRPMGQLYFFCLFQLLYTHSSRVQYIQLLPSSSCPLVVSRWRTVYEIPKRKPILGKMQRRCRLGIDAPSPLMASEP